MRPRLAPAVLTGGTETYAACRAEAERLRRRGAVAMVTPSAALRAGEARGWRVAGGIHPGPSRDGRVIVLFGEQLDLVGWRAAVDARPDPRLLRKVRYFGAG